MSIESVRQAEKCNAIEDATEKCRNVTKIEWNGRKDGRGSPHCECSVDLLLLAASPAKRARKTRKWPFDWDWPDWHDARLSLHGEESNAKVESNDHFNVADGNEREREDVAVGLAYLTRPMVDHRHAALHLQKSEVPFPRPGCLSPGTSTV